MAQFIHLSKNIYSNYYVLGVLGGYCGPYKNTLGMSLTSGFTFEYY